MSQERKLKSLRRRIDSLLRAREAALKPPAAVKPLSDVEREIRTWELFAAVAAHSGSAHSLDELAAGAPTTLYENAGELSDDERACRVAALLLKARDRKMAAKAAGTAER
jgi:hypothetical protein